MPDRSERREEIELYLEYVKVATSFAVVGTLIFAGLQWQTANRAAENANDIANLNLYRQITNEWRDHLKTMVEKPELRPYFEEQKQIGKNDQQKEAVLATADVRLDVLDAILTYFALRAQSRAMLESKLAFSGDAILGWKNTVSNAFRASPVLCARLGETKSSFANAQILPVWKASCVFPSDR
jgi:hypothetical protein